MEDVLHQICHHDPLPIYQVKKKNRTTSDLKISKRKLEKLRIKKKRETILQGIHTDPDFRFTFHQRLTPAYLFVLGINEIVMKHRVPRSVFTPAAIDHFTCEKFWWRNALYLNSLYPRSEMVRISAKTLEIYETLFKSMRAESAINFYEIYHFKLA